MRNIDQHGLLEPIGVWKANDEYVIAYGNRRLAACDKLGWTKITAKMLGELNMKDMLIINTSENLHRKDVTVAELGRIVHLLEEAGVSKGEIAVRLGVSKTKINIASQLFNNINEEHREDVVFMRQGEKQKMGKIPASIYNHLFAMRREHNLAEGKFNELIKVVKQKELSFSQVAVISSLIEDGATIAEALKSIDKFVVRRINVALNKEVEKKIMESNNIKSIGILFRKILSGEMSGTKNLVFSDKN